MITKKHSSLKYVAGVGLTAFLGGSVGALYFLRNNLYYLASQALVISSAGIMFTVFAASKVERSSSKHKVSQNENIKENLVDAYLGFCAAEIQMGHKDKIILPNALVKEELQCCEDLNVFEEELAKKLQNICLWDEMNRYKRKPLSEDTQVLFEMERKFSTVLADIQKAMEPYYFEHISHPRKKVFQLAVRKQTMDHLSDYVAQRERLTNEHDSEPKGIGESTINLIQAAETLLSNKNIFEVRDDCSIHIQQVAAYVFYHGHADLSGIDGWTKGLHLAEKQIKIWKDGVHTEPEHIEKFKNFKKYLSEIYQKPSLIDNFIKFRVSGERSEESPSDEQVIEKIPAVTTTKEAEQEMEISDCKTEESILTDDENSTKNSILSNIIGFTESDCEQAELEVEIPVIVKYEQEDSISKTVDLTESDDQTALEAEIPVITIEEAEEDTESSFCDDEKPTVIKDLEDSVESITLEEVVDISKDAE